MIINVNRHGDESTETELVLRADVAGLICDNCGGPSVDWVVPAATSAATAPEESAAFAVAIDNTCLNRLIEDGSINVVSIDPDGF